MIKLFFSKTHQIGFFFSWIRSHPEEMRANIFDDSLRMVGGRITVEEVSSRGLRLSESFHYFSLLSQTHNAITSYNKNCIRASSARCPVGNTFSCACVVFIFLFSHFSQSIWSASSSSSSSFHFHMKFSMKIINRCFRIFMQRGFQAQQSQMWLQDNMAKYYSNFTFYLALRCACIVSSDFL